MEKLGFANGYQSNRDYKTKQKNSNKYECVSAKKACRKRYNYICQICGKEGLDAHHIDFDETNNDPDNLICLCRSCHERVHLERYLWNGESYVINQDYLLKDLNPILEEYKNKYELDGFIKTTSHLNIIKDNKLIPITVEKIKNDLGIPKKEKVYVKKLTKEIKERIKMIKVVRAWNLKTNRANNKEEWHKIIDFLNNYTDDQKDTLIKLYKVATRNA